MKKGPPHREVMMPTGISHTAMLRAAVSQMIKKVPPKSRDRGIKTRCFGPVIMRTTWGTTSPTKPMIPVTEITAAA